MILYPVHSCYGGHYFICRLSLFIPRRSLILQNVALSPARSHARYRKDVIMFISVFYSRNDDPTGSERVVCDAQAKYIYQKKINVIDKLYHTARRAKLISLK
jgi:hypothetical protein